MTRYIPVNEVTKMIRADLKAAFPGQKFSVTKDRSTVNIQWEGGPSTKAVDDLVDRYSGEGFDGMTDMRYSRNEFTDENGEKCQYLTDFIFCRRELSEDEAASIKSELAIGIARETGKSITEVLDDGQFWPCPQEYMREVDRGPWEMSLYQMVRTLSEVRADRKLEAAK